MRKEISLHGLGWAKPEIKASPGNTQKVLIKHAGISYSRVISIWSSSLHGTERMTASEASDSNEKIDKMASTYLLRACPLLRGDG